MAAKDFYQVIAAKAGFAGEYEALTEAEIAAAAGAAYSPPEEGVFRVVASRVVQLLCDAPVFVKTFQTSAAEVRVPSGTVGSANDASDGRIFLIGNDSTATGTLTVADQAGTALQTLNPGDLIWVVHGDSDTWTASDPIAGTDGFGGTFRYTHHQGVPGGGTRYLRTGQSVPCSNAGDRLIADIRITGISVRTDISDGSRDYDVEIVTSPSGTPAVIATLALPSGSNSEGTSSLSVFVSAPTEIGARLVRTSGGGSSSFNSINVNVQVG